MACGAAATAETIRKFDPTKVTIADTNYGASGKMLAPIYTGLRGRGVVRSGPRSLGGESGPDLIPNDTHHKLSFVHRSVTRALLSHLARGTIK
jgi:hypothetical protein